MLREVGGPVTTYAPAGDAAAWAAAVHGVVARGRDPAERAAAVAWAGQFTWPRHAAAVAAGYAEFGGRRCG